MNDLITLLPEKQARKLAVKTGWYIGRYTLNANSGSSPMPDAGTTGLIFIYFYKGADKRTYSVLYQKSTLPFQPNLLEKHGPYADGDYTFNPVGWGAVTDNTHCEFFLPKAEMLPGGYIRSKAGESADIYYLKDNETLYYYHTSWHAEFIGDNIGDMLTANELKTLKDYIGSVNTQVKLC